ncbi:MAG: hypothetical protein ACI4PM_06385, partial [Butyricicoccus sp.]
LKDNNLSQSLVNQACCVITPQSLAERQYMCSGAWVLMDKSVPSNIPQRTVQSGTYACLYRNYVAMDGKSESVGLDQLLDFIYSNHYQIVGPYLGEIAAQMSIFDYSNNSILVKLQIPVKISE